MVSFVIITIVIILDGGPRMKQQWIAGIALLTLASTYCQADDITPPTDNILKDQFYADFTGLI
jgi:hypothetical protein